MTYYLFFDTWNPPFDNLKVRQAFSHAIDRDKLVNGPLQYQAAAAYTMNPPGFPGESVDELKDVQNLRSGAGQAADGRSRLSRTVKGFPKLTLYTARCLPGADQRRRGDRRHAQGEPGRGRCRSRTWTTAMFMDKLRQPEEEPGRRLHLRPGALRVRLRGRQQPAQRVGRLRRAKAPTCPPCPAATPGTARSTTTCCARPARSSDDEAKRNELYQSGRADPRRRCGAGAHLSSDLHRHGQALSQGAHVRSQRFRLEDLDALPLRARESTIYKSTGVRE